MREQRDINRDWYPAAGDKPALNTWYPCKRGDDYYKIIRGSRGSYNNDRRTWDTRPTYRVVSMRGADIGFDLTLAMARTMIYTETRRC